MTACDGSPRQLGAKWAIVHAEGEYRVSYVAKFEDAVCGLHVVAKKTRKASSQDVELGKKRYREVLERRK